MVHRSVAVALGTGSLKAEVHSRMTVAGL